MVCQLVERCTGEPFATQHFCPLLERQIGRDDHARTFVGGADHIKEQLRTRFAGRHLRVSADCHPPEGLRVIQLECFQELADRVKELYQALIDAHTNEPIGIVAERWLPELGLKWPSCIDGLPSKLAVDLQNDEPDRAVSA